MSYEQFQQEIPLCWPFFFLFLMVQKYFQDMFVWERLRKKWKILISVVLNEEEEKWLNETSLMPWSVSSFYTSSNTKVPYFTHISLGLIFSVNCGNCCWIGNSAIFVVFSYFFLFSLYFKGHLHENSPIQLKFYVLLFLLDWPPVIISDERASKAVIPHPLSQVPFPLFHKFPSPKLSDSPPFYWP